MENKGKTLGTKAKQIDAGSQKKEQKHNVQAQH